MKQSRTIGILVFCIVIMASTATISGIYSRKGDGKYRYTSIRGNTVEIYGKGLYKHMSVEVAPQGIAQDYVTLFAGVPLLLVSFYFFQRGSLKGQFLLAGTLMYFLVTYMFYLTMAMYNQLFLGYVFLLGSSFFAFALCCLAFDIDQLRSFFLESSPVKLAGAFLILSECLIALLWLSITLPPLLNGTIIPPQVEHYTTLIVQGLDLAILLPLSFVSGVLFIRKKTLGYFLAPVFLVFLSLLMTALTAKIIAMAILGYNVIPAVFIIPIFNIGAIVCAILVLKKIKPRNVKHVY